MYFTAPKNCPHPADLELTDVSSKLQMETKGWAFSPNIRHKPLEFNNTCGKHNTWYGDKNPDVAGSFVEITATFTGSGTATLDYGNCRDKGKVNVNLGRDRVDTAYENTTSKLKKFKFFPKQVLSLRVSGPSVIKLNSLQLTCQGKKLL